MKKKQAWKVMGAVLVGTLVFSGCSSAPCQRIGRNGKKRSTERNCLRNGERYRDKDKTGSRLCESENRR